MATKCGTNRKTGTKLCISDKPIPGMRCGRNPKNKKYACASGKGGGRRGGKGKKRKVR